MATNKAVIEELTGGALRVEHTAAPHFRRLSALDVIALYERGDEVLERLKAEFSEVFADEGHPRRASIALRIRILGELVPAVSMAWEGGCPFDPASLPYEELLAYAKEVRRVNPFLEHLPEPDGPNPIPPPDAAAAS